MKYIFLQGILFWFYLGKNKTLPITAFLLNEYFPCYLLKMLLYSNSVYVDSSPAGFFSPFRYVPLKEGYQSNTTFLNLNFYVRLL